MNRPASLKIAHVITDLDVGGAEGALRRLASELRRRGHEQQIWSLVSAGRTGEDLRDDGFVVRALGIRSLASAAGGVLRLSRDLRGYRPDVVQTWMYHADVIGGLAARLGGLDRVVWGIRQTDLSREAVKFSTRAVARLAAVTSRRLPAAAVCASHASLAAHGAFGYRPQRTVVIDNGVDIPASPSGARERLRAELGLGTSQPVVGRVARFDRQKDFSTLARAIAAVAESIPDVALVLCGPGCEEGNGELVRVLEDAGVSHRAHYLGSRTDVTDVYRTCDVVCSSSFAEGFPNVVAEAMAAGVPVVVTDAGDSARLVGDASRVAPIRDPIALAGRLQAILRLPPSGREALGASDRRRIAEKFSMDRMGASFEQLYWELCADVRH